MRLLVSCCFLALLTFPLSLSALELADGLHVAPPAGWALIEVHRDDGAALFALAAPDALVEIYVLRAHGAHASSPESRKRWSEAALREFLNVERLTDYEIKGRAPLKLRGCNGDGTTYRDGDWELRLVTCLDPHSGSLFAWRLVADATTDKVDLLNDFFAFVATNFYVLDAQANPESTVETTP